MSSDNFDYNFQMYRIRRAERVLKPLRYCVFAIFLTSFVLQDTSFQAFFPFDLRVVYGISSFALLAIIGISGHYERKKRALNKRLEQESGDSH